MGQARVSQSTPRRSLRHLLLALAALLLLALYVVSSDRLWPTPFVPSPRFLAGWAAVVACAALLVLIGRAWGEVLRRLLPAPKALVPWEMEIALVLGGLLLLSTMYCCLAFAHLSTAAVLAAAFLPLLVVGRAPTIRFVRGVVASARSHPREALLVVAIALFATFLSARPDTSLDGLIYQAALPEIYLKHGSYVRLTNNIHAGLPNAGNFLFLPGLAAGAWPLTKAVQPTFLVLLILLLRCASGLGLTARRWLVLSMLLVSIPSLAVNASTLYVDVTLTAIVSALLLIAMLFLRTKDRALLPWTAFFGFAALAIKWTPAPVVLCVFAIAAVFAASERMRPTVFEAVAAAGSAVVLLAPCLLKNILLYGSPVFPALIDRFPAPVNWSPDRQALSLRFLQETFGVGRTLPDFLLLPLNVISLARPDTILPSGHRPFDGLFGVAPTLAFLALLTARGGDRAERALRILALGSFAAWAAFSQQIRFLLPTLPLAIALALRSLEGPPPPEGRARPARSSGAGALLAFSLLIAAVGAAQALALATPHLARWSRSQSAGEYVLASLGNEGRLYAWMRENLAPADRCLFLGMNVYPTLIRNETENDPVFTWYSFEQRLSRAGVSDDLLPGLLRERRCNVLVANVELPFRYGTGDTKLTAPPFDALVAKGFSVVGTFGPYRVLRTVAPDTTIAR